MDTCDYGVGAILVKDSNESEAVIAHGSQILQPSEITYILLKKEAMGTFWALKHFYPYLYNYKM